MGNFDTSVSQMTKHPCPKCVKTRFHKQLGSSSAPELPMAIMADVSREVVDAHPADTPGLTLVFMGP